MICSKPGCPVNSRFGKTLIRAAAQQGLIQMVLDFCDHSNAICDRCKLPELVRDWTAQGSESSNAKT